jgi:hypothetical protein
MSVTKINSRGLDESHYFAEACIVWCFDARTSGDLDDFLTSRGFERADVVKVAGGAKAFAFDPSSARSEEEIESGLAARGFLLSQVKASIRLHESKTVILMLHVDCGGYGYSKAFPDTEAELAHHEKELESAEKFLADKLPNGITIETVMVIK